MAIPESFIASAAQQLNSGAHHFRIGGLPNIRQRLTGRRPTTRSTFDGRTTFPTYAFHVSGRQELQFNIGTEGTLENPELRYGVAFSLQLGRNLPTIEPLLPKISRFNEFSRLYPERFENIKAWYWRGDERSADYPPTPIRPEWVVPPTFIFFGQRQPIDVLDYDAILTLFDRLLPLYEYTEGGDGAQPIELRSIKCLSFVRDLPLAKGRPSPHWPSGISTSICVTMSFKRRFIISSFLVTGKRMWVPRCRMASALSWTLLFGPTRVCGFMRLRPEHPLADVSARQLDNCLNMPLARSTQDRQVGHRWRRPLRSSREGLSRTTQ